MKEKEIVGIWEVIRESKKVSSEGRTMYDIRCIHCGKESTMTLKDMQRAKECKHINQFDETVFLANYKWGNRDIGNIFKDVRARCYNPKRKDYPTYGGKGIVICDEWNKNPLLFEIWAKENGYEKGLALHRKDLNGDYTPENCEWIPLSDALARKGNTNLIEVRGIKKSGKGWASFLGLSPNMVNRYLKRNGLEKTIEYIISTANDNNIKF